MPVPVEPNKKQKAVYAKMAKTNGAAFDKAFARHMVVDHKEGIAEYTKAASLKNEPAASYASSTLPTLHKHLETAQTLVKVTQR